MKTRAGATVAPLRLAEDRRVFRSLVHSTLPRMLAVLHASRAQITDPEELRAWERVRADLEAKTELYRRRLARLERGEHWCDRPCTDPDGFTDGVCNRLDCPHDNQALDSRDNHPQNAIVEGRENG